MHARFKCLCVCVCGGGRPDGQFAPRIGARACVALLQHATFAALIAAPRSTTARRRAGANRRAAGRHRATARHHAATGRGCWVGVVVRGTALVLSRRPFCRRLYAALIEHINLRVSELRHPPEQFPEQIRFRARLNVLIDLVRLRHTVTVAPAVVLRAEESAELLQEAGGDAATLARRAVRVVVAALLERLLARLARLEGLPGQLLLLLIAAPLVLLNLVSQLEQPLLAVGDQLRELCDARSEVKIRARRLCPISLRLRLSERHA